MSAAGREPVWAGAFLWRAGGSAWLSLAVLVGLCLAVFLPGFFTIPPVDRDESRFAQASRQMFEAAALPEGEREPAKHGGGWAVPMVQDRPRLNKPPLIYWLQAGSAWVFTGGEPLRDAIWMYRVPSLLGGIAAVLGTWWIGRSMFDGRVGVLAGAMLAVCPVVAWEAHQARADMVLLACVVVAMGGVWRVWSGARADAEEGTGAPGHRGIRGWIPPLVFWTAMGLGVMTKGPIAPMVAGLAVLSLCLVTGRWAWLRRLRPMMGGAMVAAIVAPWAWVVAERVGWNEYLRVIADETLGRSVSAKEGHWGPPGYHLVLLAVLFWPGSLLTAAGFVEAWRRVFGIQGRMSRDAEGEGRVSRGAGTPVLGRARLVGWWADRGEAWASSPGLLFCLAWAVPGWIVFEAVGTKLPHYTMVLYPAVAIVSAWAAADLAGARTLRGWGPRAWLVIGVFWAVVSAAALVQGFLAGDTVVLAGVAVAAATIFSLVKASLAIRACVPLRAQVWGIIAMVTAGAVLLGVSADDFLGLSARTVAAVRGIDPQGRRPLAAVGYHEDSLVFLTRARIERIGLESVGSWFAEHPDGLAIMRMVEASDRTDVRVIETIGGFNYSRGRPEWLGVVELDR